MHNIKGDVLIVLNMHMDLKILQNTIYAEKNVFTAIFRTQGVLANERVGSEFWN